MKMPRNLAVWEYLSEVVATLLLVGLAFVRISPGKLTKWLFDSHSDIGSMVTGGLTLTGLAFGAFIAILVTDFGAKLRRFGQARPYTIAFAVPPIANVASLVSLTFVRTPSSITAGSIALLLTTYALISTLTMLRNFIDLVGMWEAVEKARTTGKRE